MSSSLVPSPVTLPADAVTISDSHAVTTSLKIAEIFGRNHRDVTRAIRNLEIPNDFRLRNFAQAEFIDKNGDAQPMFEIRRDGFVLLVMGFTGRLATAFKIAYIERYNELEARDAAPALPDPAAREAQVILREVERRLNVLQRTKREAKRALVENRARDGELAELRIAYSAALSEARAARALALDGHPHLRRVLHYAGKDLNADEIQRLTDVPADAITALLAQAEAAGFLPGLNEDAQDLVNMVRNGLVTLPPTTH